MKTCDMSNKKCFHNDAGVSCSSMLKVLT